MPNTSSLNYIFAMKINRRQQRSHKALYTQNPRCPHTLLQSELVLKITLLPIEYSISRLYGKCRGFYFFKSELTLKITLLPIGNYVKAVIFSA